MRRLVCVIVTSNCYSEKKNVLFHFLFRKLICFVFYCGVCVFFVCCFLFCFCFIYDLVIRYNRYVSMFFLYVTSFLIDVIFLLITYLKDQCFLNWTSACKLIICLISRICNNEYLQRSCLIIRLNYAIRELSVFFVFFCCLFVVVVFFRFFFRCRCFLLFFMLY